MNFVTCSSFIFFFFSGKCQVLTIPLCQKLPYNMTMFPNLVHHKTQGEAALEVHQFYPLVLTNCSSYLTLFLCSLYAPICTILNRPLPPCRGLCNRVKNGCLPLLQKFGFSWPESMACKKFPERNGLGICVDLATIAAVTTQPPRPTDGKISVNDIWNKSYMNCGNEMKVKKWSSQLTQFMQVRKEAWNKFTTSTGFEPVTSRLAVRCSTNWAMKLLVPGT